MANFPLMKLIMLVRPNSLRLKWRSQSGGDWLMTLKVKARYGTADSSGSSLFFWCYSETDLPVDESPLILRDGILTFSRVHVLPRTIVGWN